mmetsp:Transcript_25566/g.33160  ORF Transcript_25566/g.33160 Transcript_25566/m.33160 type:complete len:213 (+) Transcript_25566:110-748(+)
MEGKRPTFERKLSVVSEETLLQLDNLEKTYAGFEKVISDIDEGWSSSRLSLEELYSAKNVLAQTLGCIDKFQFEGVDAVVTFELTSGQEEAKSRRKALNRNVSTLRESASSLFQRLSTYLQSQPLPEPMDTEEVKKEETKIEETTPLESLQRDRIQQYLVKVGKLKSKDYITEAQSSALVQMIQHGKSEVINFIEGHPKEDRNLAKGLISLL